MARRERSPRPAPRRPAKTPRPRPAPPGPIPRPEHPRPRPARPEPSSTGASSTTAGSAGGDSSTGASSTAAGSTGADSSTGASSTTAGSAGGDSSTGASSTSRPARPGPIPRPAPLARPRRGSTGADSSTGASSTAPTPRPRRAPPEPTPRPEHPRQRPTPPGPASPRPERLQWSDRRRRRAASAGSGGGGRRRYASPAGAAAGGLLLGGVTASRRTQRLRCRGVGRHLHAEQGGDLGQQRPEALHRGRQLVGAGFRCGGRDHQGADRRERHRLQHRRPAIRPVGGLQRGGRRLGQTRGQRAGERDAGLRRLRRQPQGPHHPADLEGRLDVGEPQGQLLVLLRHQRRLERGGERTGGLVAGDQRVVGRRHDAAQVAQVEVLELALRGLGAVQPVGDAELGEQVLGHLHHRRLRHLRLALGLQADVVLAQPLAHGRHPLQGELGDGALLLRRRRQHLGAVQLARAQALRLGPLRHLGGRREVRTLAPSVLALATGRAITAALVGPGAGRPVAAFTRRSPVATGRRRDARPGHRRDGAGADRRSDLPGAVLDDRLEALLARQQLQQAGPRRLLLVRDDRQHPDAVDVVFGLDPQLVADRRPARQDRTVEHATRLSGPGGAPGPRTVRCRARQLDLDADRHRRVTVQVRFG